MDLFVSIARIEAPNFQLREHSAMPKLRLLLSASAIIFVSLLPKASGAATKTASGVVTALQQKYQLTETSTDSEQITKDGTTMVMKTAGIYSFPSNVYMKPDNHVIDGKIKSPSFFVKATWEKMGAHVLQTGDKVYITKMDSKSEGGDTLRFTVLSTESIDVSGTDSKKKFLANVSFTFKKGYLDETPPEQVEQVIESVLAPDAGDDKKDDKTNEAAAAPPAAKAAPAPVAPPPPPPAAPAGPPPTITVGETSTEVLQAMGMPLQMIDLGKKKTYVYKNMKVVFLNDKVSDVQ
jgi:hypothetical protein